MARRPIGTVLQQLCNLIGSRGAEGMSDGALLQRFVQQREEAAFEALVQRYGPLVHGLCRRLLKDSHDADDAFQATFLVLANKAASVRRHDAVGSWLYGVATRVAADARSRAARRRLREQPGTDLEEKAPDVSAADDPVAAASLREVRGVLDEELSRLPEKYRAPLVLCYLQGMTNEEAAQSLGRPTGSISRQLTRGRDLLQQRLARRGVGLASAAVAALLTDNLASAVVPAPLLETTVKMALLYTAGQTGAPLGAPAVALAEGVLKAMTLTKVKIVTAACLILALVGSAAGLRFLTPATAEPPRTNLADAPPDPKPADKPPVVDKAAPAQPDLVEDLREALRTPVKNSTNREELEFRRALILKRVKALAAEGQRLGIGDMRRALMLDEWRHEDKDEAIATIDRGSRNDLITKFEGAVREVLTKGSPAQKLAAVDLLGEIGVRIVARDGATNLTRDFALDMIRLTGEKDPALRAAAVRTLGKINPDPKIAGPALAEALKSEDVAVRRAAAEALVSLLRSVQGSKRLAAVGRIEHLTLADAAQTTEGVARLSGRGLADPDAEVRRLCLEALQLAGSILVDFVPWPRPDFPPPGREPTADELAEIAAYRQMVEQERTHLLPVARTLAAQLKGVTERLDDPVPTCAIGAAGVLEAASAWRQSLSAKAASVPRVGNEPKPDPLDEDPLRKPLRTAVPALVKQLAAPAVRSRLAAIYALETMKHEAAAAAPALVQALNDENSFVRWGAARALGLMAPAEAAAAVPALAKRLEDDTLDVRAAAAQALERYGSAAKPAVAALADGATRKGSGIAVLAIAALAAVGPEAKLAVPMLLASLSSPRDAVRAAAARALGKIAPADPDVIAALRQALKDPDEAVREAAGDSLLLAK